MSPTKVTSSPKKKAVSVAPALPGAYTGKLLRVDMTKRKCWAEAWSPEEMRQWLGGAGLGALLLYRETATRAGKGNVAWDHPDNRLVLATGPLAGLPVWGTGALTVITIGAMTNGPTSTQANGFFGTNLKYCGYDAIVIQGQSKDWLYLYIHDDVIELRDARTLVGLDTWETQEALNRQLGLSATSSPCTPSAPPERSWSASPPFTATTATWPPRTAAERSWARSGSKPWPS
jgi:aldehyde:ferredoxin oxidoreductase